MLIYALSKKRQRIHFSDNVVDQFLKHRQVLGHQKEAGGQLFATITPKLVTVSAATGPHKCDTRSRFALFFGKRRIQKEINYNFTKGLHYIGDWHTHPEHLPIPSQIDFSSMKECFEKSVHELNYFILVVVGQSANPHDIWVGLVNSINIIRLRRFFDENCWDYDG